MKYKTAYFVFSGLLVLISLSSLITFGLKPSIDFVGGSLFEFKFNEQSEKIGSEEITNKLGEIESIEISSIQYSDDTQSNIIRLNAIQEPKKNEIVNKLSEDYGEIEELRFETVGPTLGRELLIKTLIAVILASIAIMAYVGYQFKDKYYGLSAILAMFHDTIVLMGIFSLLGHFRGVEVDALFVTAVLTTLSFSVHDTIVVFDRIRETVKYKPNEKFENIVNTAITQTLPRSLNNSLTIMFMLLSLFLLGGSTISWFVFALFAGTVLGTYSSPFVAAPLFLVFINKGRKSDN